MAMTVDAAREHETAGRVDLAPARRETFAKRHDATVFDPDIASRPIGGGHDGTVADHQIAICHLAFPSPRYSVKLCPISGAGGNRWREEAKRCTAAMTCCRFRCSPAFWEAARRRF